MRIGTTCEYLPPELIEALGGVAVRLTGVSGREANVGKYTHPNLCGYARAVVSEAVDGRYGELDGVAVVNSCDAMRRVGDLLKMVAPDLPSWVVDLPRKEGAEAETLYAHRLRTLTDQLAERFDRSLDPTALDEAIAVRNRSRELVRRWDEIGRDRGYPLGAAGHFAPLAERTQVAAAEFNATMEQSLADLEAEPNAGGARRPRVLLTGGYYHMTPLLEALDAAGIEVTVVDHCLSGRMDEPVERNGDAFADLARAYLTRRPCPRMAFAGRRLDWIEEWVGTLAVDGVVFVLLSGCDQFMYDLPLLKSKFGEDGPPILALESSMPQSHSQQWKTRLEAFTELLWDRTGG